MHWTCRICHTSHTELPLCYGADAPWRELVPEDEFHQRVELNDDLCVVDERVFFIRGHIELPILGSEETFAWSAWSSLSRDSFVHCQERWESPSRAGDSYFGWLSTALPVYSESTIHLKLNVVSREPGQVPFFHLHESSHELYREQVHGISRNRIEEFAHAISHQE